MRQVWKRRVAKYSRWLHVYVSMGSCVIVLFFAVTGLTLNHTEWFAGAERTAQSAGVLDVAWIAAGRTDVARLEVVEFLRRTHGLSGAVSDFRVEDTEVSVSLKGPGYSADTFIDRQTGKYELTETRLGVVAIANDLHKGRDTGAVWKATVDVSAALLVFVALSGLVLLYFVHKHRFTGFVLLGIGGVFSYALYAIWVP